MQLKQQRPLLFLWVLVFVCGGAAVSAQAAPGAPFWSLYVGNFWGFNGYDAHGNTWTYWNEVSRKDAASFPGVDTYVVDSYQDGNPIGSVWFSFDLTEIKEWREVFWDYGRQEAVTVSAAAGLTWSRNPLYAGAHWRTQTGGVMTGSSGWSRPVTITLDVTVVSQETVFVPLGEYTAYRGRFVFHVWNTPEGIDYARTDERWFIPYLGAVKIQTTLGTYTAHNEVFLLGTRKGIADYTGSEATEVAAYHLPSNQFFAEPAGNLGQYGWEGSNCLPVVWDSDGDGLMEIAIYHIPSNQWFVRGHPGDNLGQFGWGAEDSVPVPGDYDGDGAMERAFYHTPTNRWFIEGRSPIQFGFGGADCIPLPGDYDGDGRTDLALYHLPSNQWFLYGTGNLGQFGWDGADCLPVPADYDGDGKTDVAVYHVPSGQWLVKGLGNLGRFGWGGLESFPIPGDYDGGGVAEQAFYRAGENAWFVRGFANFIWGWEGADFMPLTGQTAVLNWYRFVLNRFP
jgi:hypothetical protein